MTSYYFVQAPTIEPDKTMAHGHVKTFEGQGGSKTHPPNQLHPRLRIWFTSKFHNNKQFGYLASCEKKVGGDHFYRSLVDQMSLNL